MRCTAFTLIEILVVIAIIAVLSAMAVPSLFASFRQATLREEARRLVDTAQYAQRMAVTKRRTLRLVFLSQDPEHDGRSSYHLELATNDLDATESFGKLIGTPVKPAVLPESLRLIDVRIEAPSADPSVRALHFFADGSSDGGVIVFGDDRATRTLIVEPTTGKLELVPGGAAFTPPQLREDLDA